MNVAEASESVSGNELESMARQFKAGLAPEAEGMAVSECLDFGDGIAHVPWIHSLQTLGAVDNPWQETNTAAIALSILGQDNRVVAVDGLGPQFTWANFPFGNNHDYSKMLATGLGEGNCLLGTDFDSVAQQLQRQQKERELRIGGAASLTLVGAGASLAYATLRRTARSGEHPRRRFLRLVAVGVPALLLLPTVVALDTRADNARSEKILSALNRCDLDNETLLKFGSLTTPDEYDVVARTAISHFKVAHTPPEFYLARGLRVPEVKFAVFGASHYAPSLIEATRDYIADPARAVDHVFDKDVKLVAALQPLRGWTDEEAVQRLAMVLQELTSVTAYRVGFIEEGKKLRLDAVPDQAGVIDYAFPELELKNSRGVNDPMLKRYAQRRAVQQRLAQIKEELKA